MLLPWYATGRLEPCRHGEGGELSRPASAGGAPARPGARRAGADGGRQRDPGLAVCGSARPAHGRAAGNAFRRSAAKAPVRCSSSVSRSSSRSRPPAACAGRRRGVAALVAVQTIAIATLLLGDRGGSYQVASGQQAGGEGVSALVAFTDEATAPAISRLLTEFRAKIVDGPKSGGVYTIRLRLEDRSQAEAQLRRLDERRDIVRAVLPSRD